LIFGSLAFTPLQGFLSIKSWQFSGGVPAGANPWISIGPPRELAGSTFLRFYPLYLANCFHVPGSVLLRIGCFTSHLWFLAFLLIYSVICLPLFERLGGAWGAQWVDRLAAICQKPWGLLACFLPTAAVQILLRARFSQHHHWSDFLFWLVYFIYGYLFLTDRRFLEALRAQWKKAGWVGLICFGGMMALLGLGGYAESWEFRPTFSAGYAFYQALRSLNTWGWVVFFLGLSMRYLNIKRGWLGYGREAVLPFYILHQAAIVAVAFALFAWQPPILIKFLALAGGAFLITAGVYELLVRRVNLLRFLFGMRPKPQAEALPSYSSISRHG
jgi:hypothetical protein